MTFVYLVRVSTLGVLGAQFCDFERKEREPDCSSQIYAKKERLNTDNKILSFSSQLILFASSPSESAKKLGRVVFFCTQCEMHIKCGGTFFWHKVQLGLNIIYKEFEVI